MALKQLAQLWQLIWKNILQQSRTPFTAVEFIFPLLLIGVTFGLLIGLQYKYESSTNSAISNKRWLIQGSAVDLITPPDSSQSHVNTIVDTQYILTGLKQANCMFLNVTRHANKFFHHIVTANIALEIVYTPSNPGIDNIMKIIKERYTNSDIVKALSQVQRNTPPLNYTLPKFDPKMMLIISSEAKITPKLNEQELMDYITDSLSQTPCNNPIIGGIVFDEEFALSIERNGNATSDIVYSIRLSSKKRRYSPLSSGAHVPWTTKIKFAVPSRNGPIYLLNNPDDGGYWQEGFLTLQKAVDAAFHKIKTGNELPAVLLQPFTYFPNRHVVMDIASFFLPIVIAFSFMFNVIYITRSIVVEKETRQKSYMIVMGLSQWLLWLSYFIINFIKLLIIVIILSALFYILMPKSDPTVALVFFLLYAVNVIYMAFAISVFLNSGDVAIQIIPFVWVILYAWELLFTSIDSIAQFSPAIRLLNALNPNIALAYGIRFMCQYEMWASGIYWSQIIEHASPDEPLSLCYFFLMLIIDTFILMIITWYVEAVNPGCDIVPQKPYFLFLSSYWRARKHSDKYIEEQADDIKTDKPIREDLKIEAAPKSLHATVDIIDLCKTYQKSLFRKLFYCSFKFQRKKKETKALKHLHTKMYRGQITVLLGQNGAGKSSAISVLTGVLKPTSGMAYIEGFDIRKELTVIRTRLGLCSQYNIIFDCLTVMEHLKLLCKLKGRSWDEKEVDDLLQKLNMENDAYVYGQYLSGGQKRKLSLAIALIGGSEVVVLDEPTTGMDPDVRHEAWSLLQHKKKKRTVLLTTHYMDEADILADRITILAHGELQCSGSGLFLKQSFSAGYRLTVLYQPTQNAEEHANHVLKTVTLVRELTTASVKQSSNGFEVIFSLPGELRQNFAELFRKLEENVVLFGISTLGVSASTMEEVFLNVCENAAKKSVEKDVPEDEKHEFSVAELKYENRLQSGRAYYVQQFLAMFYKRFAYFCRKRAFFVLQLLFPAICMSLIVVAFLISPIPTVPEKLPINFEPYNGDGEAAIIYVQNVTIPSYPKTLRRAIRVAASVSSQHKYPFRVIVTNNITASIIKGLPDQKSTEFGTHNPVGYNLAPVNDWFIAMFNNYALHSSPLAVNLADIAITSLSVGRNIFIQVSNHPLPAIITDRLESEKMLYQPALSIAAMMSLSVLVASFINFIIYERTTKCKHMQMLCGLKHWIYWFTAFLWDYMICFIAALLCLGVFYAVNLTEYIDRGSIAVTMFFVMLLYALAELPFVYLCSAIFNSSAEGSATVFIYNFMTGIMGIVTVATLEELSDSFTAWIISIVWAFLFPTYNLSSCFSKAYTNEYTRQACAFVDCSRPEIQNSAKYCCGSADERLFVDDILLSTDKTGILLMVIFFLVHSIIFWLAVVAYEANLCTDDSKFSLAIKRLLQKIWNKVTGVAENACTDDDVISECKKVHEMNSNDAIIIVQDLEKWFGWLNAAVRKTNFHVNKGECFGLLGVNGAGKTTTFQMLTGEIQISDGDAFIYGCNVRTEWREASSHIGYCPQFDALIDEMTGREALSMFARLRGVRGRDVRRVVDTIMRAVVISKYGNNLIKTYSGGNKRRLSLAVALITLPDVLLLDGPTTGVDPKGSRIIWNILSKVRESGTTLVLTSYNMEECEALCTRIAFMVNGQFQCFGSTQRIKAKYGNGYNLGIRLQNFTQIKTAKELVANTFPESILTDQHMLHLNYELGKAETLSMLFEKVEALAGQAGAIDYSISKTPLDQIFLKFSRKARTEGEDAKKESEEETGEEEKEDEE